jgi:hypothetical protein
MHMLERRNRDDNLGPWMVDTDDTNDEDDVDPFNLDGLDEPFPEVDDGIDPEVLSVSVSTVRRAIAVVGTALVAGIIIAATTSERPKAEQKKPDAVRPLKK